MSAHKAMTPEQRQASLERQRRMVPKWERHRRRQAAQAAINLGKLAQLHHKRFGRHLPGAAQVVKALAFLAEHGTGGRLRMPGFGTLTFRKCMKAAQGAWPPPTTTRTFPRKRRR